MPLDYSWQQLADGYDADMLDGRTRFLAWSAQSVAEWLNTVHEQEDLQPGDYEVKQVMLHRTDFS